MIIRIKKKTQQKEAKVLFIPKKHQLDMIHRFLSQILTLKIIMQLHLLWTSVTKMNQVSIHQWSKVNL